MDFSEFFQNQEVLRNVISSAILLFSITIIRFFTIRSVNTSKSIPNEHRRQWIVKTKTILLFVFVLGLLIIWASELQAFAVSLVAVAAAVVIATKEVIMNFTGYFARASGKPFSIGDRIEVNGIRGDVIDQNLFFTKVLEIGPGKFTHQYTGRSISIPNSTFLGGTHIINESFTKTYTLHVFQIPVRVSSHLSHLQKELLDISERACSKYIDKAQSAFELFGLSQGLDSPSVESRVHIHFLDKETAEFIVRIPAPTKRKGRIEQEIVKEFSEKYVATLN